MVGAANNELVYLTFDRLVFHVGETFMSAVRAGLPSIVFLEPAVEAAVAEVLATAASEVGLTEYVRADVADEFLR